ncbi:palmitoyltransferase zdhhc2 [Anaeramoeba flamelloides]|uniref:Palmitoyltransferase n=1 Tax=Anaeramoeba flamelloides TaxID=1746091 RepID=A0ABQ8YTB3_9EUKA|nr:palmitoyltransferase zdhhc2 [Anaeramoeba flamelloides]
MRPSINNSNENTTVLKCYVGNDWYEQFVSPQEIPKVPLTENEHYFKASIPNPPRALYSKMFRGSVRKIDHVCYLIGNMVGFFNYKFFLLTLLYGNVANCIAFVIIIFSLFFQEEIVAYIISASLGIICMVFGYYVLKISKRHCYLLKNNLTSIENFDRKEFKKKNIRFVNVYDLGLKKNFQQVFGKNPLYWLMPFRFGLKEDGYSFPENGEIWESPIKDNNWASKNRVENSFDNENDEEIPIISDEKSSND